MKYLLNSLFVSGPKSALFAFRNTDMSFIFRVRVALWVWKKIVDDTVKYIQEQK